MFGRKKKVEEVEPCHVRIISDPNAEPFDWARDGEWLYRFTLPSAPSVPPLERPV
jgi:hypothetical protein